MLKNTALVVFIILISTTQYIQAQCAFGQSWTVNPQPVNNTYQAGQEVSFCFTVGGYTQNAANWIHGFVFSFGPGWDMTTLQITQLPTSCSASGYWQYFPTCVSGLGAVFGPGVYYDYATVFSPPDGNPGNNFGDNNINNSCTWVLCFKLKVKNSCNAESLNFGITVTGDGASGSWGSGSGSCAGVLNNALTGVNCTMPCSMVLSYASTNPGCANNDGQITVNTTGGVAPLSYQWSNQATTQTITGISAGNYLVTVTDGTGCQMTGSQSITNTDSSKVTTTIGADIQCFSYCTGALGAFPLMGTPPYTYTWSNGQSSQNISNLCAGLYTVTMVDAHQCASTATFNLTQPPVPQYNLTATGTSCYQSGDGSASINITGGNLPITLIWQPSGQTGVNATFLTPGVYTVKLTDAMGCTLKDSVIITQPPKIKTDITVTDVDCFGASSGKIVLTPTVGNAPYNYQWSNAGGSGNINQNIPAGVYSVTITDATNCTTDTSTIVNQPPSMIINFDMQPASCEISADGILTAIPLGGTAPFQYNWNNNANAATINGLNPGAYSVTVTDVNNCTASGNTVLVAQPTFSVDAGPDKSVVKGFTTDLMALPSTTGNYTYSWAPPQTVSNPTIYNVIVKPIVTTTYTITIVNIDNGCTASDEVVVTVIPNEFLFVPNAFSPNGDGFNNTIFPIPGDGIVIKSFRIYNRWGQLVHDGSVKLAWDGNFNGTPCDIGVYSYYCEYTNPEGGEYRKQGTILLMR